MSLLENCHPAAELFPLVEGVEFEALVESVREHGLLEPVWLLADGRLLDGRNRVRACERLGIEPETRVYSGDSPVAAVLGWNLSRRHLNEGQRALIGLEALPLREAEAELRRKAGVQSINKTVDNLGARGHQPNREPRAADLAAEQVGVSGRSIARAKRVKEKAPELLAKIESGELSLRKAEESLSKPHVANNSGVNEWYTPTGYVEAARELMGGIDLDPASSVKANEVVKATRFYTAAENGLTQDWGGNVFMNPPYSSNLIGGFVDKLCSSYKSGDVSRFVVLVNNATETVWFQKLSEISDGVCFPSGRVKFWGPNGEVAAPLQGQAILWGSHHETFNKFETSFNEFGDVWGKEHSSGA